MAKAVRTEIELNAPPAAVWALLADVEHWQNWNNIFFFSKADLRVNGKAMLKVGLGPTAAPVPVRFQTVAEQQELRWHGGLSAIGYGSHYIKLEAMPNNRTRLIHGEEFKGAAISLAWPAMKRSLPKLYRKFNQQVAAALR